MSVALCAVSLSSCQCCNREKNTDEAVEAAAVAEDTAQTVVLFDGTSLDGWRGYNKTDVPKRWVIEDGALKIVGGGAGEAQKDDGGDLIYAAQKFGNFELTFEWKVAKGSNSGVFYLAQEIEGLPIYFSAPEYQILDNENHPDAKLGVEKNRQSASLYDMIPAVPQNAKPFGEWNTGGVTIYKGTVIHWQNDVPVVEYHLWTDQWTDMVANSKFKKDGPLGAAYPLLVNAGGENHEGYIGFQDHGDDVWFRNIKVKILD